MVQHELTVKQCAAPARIAETASCHATVAVTTWLRFCHFSHRTKLAIIVSIDMPIDRPVYKQQVADHDVSAARCLYSIVLY